MASTSHHTQTISDLDTLEAQIQEEEKTLQSLKESIDKAGSLTQKLVKTLQDLDDRIAELDPVIMPIHRMMQGFTLIHENVENTVDLLNKIESYNRLAEEEEDVINRGYFSSLMKPIMKFSSFLANGRVTTENISEYLASINRVSDASIALKKKNLDFCSSTQTRLVQVSHQGLAKALAAFQEWLSASSVPLDSTQPAMLLEQLQESRELINEAQASALKMISGFAAVAENQQPFNQLLEIYSQCRSAYLAKSLEGTLHSIKESLAEQKSSYQKGSHPYLLALNIVARMLKEEDMFAHLILPGTSIEDVLKRTVSGVADEWQRVTQTLVAGLNKAYEKHQFMDHIYVYDLIEGFNDLYSASSTSLATLKGSLLLLTQTGMILLSRLRMLVDSEGKQNTSIIPAPQNSTVFELTSIVINCLRRMLEYERVIEAITVKMEMKAAGTLSKWDGYLGPLPTDYEIAAMCRYYQEDLKLLEVAIDYKSRSYRKAMSSVVFRLNNYRYILKAFTTSTLSSMLTSECESRYQEVCQQLRDQFLASWKGIAGALNPEAYPEVPTQISPSTVPKDRIKIFMAELDEAVKLQSTITIPDAELRLGLKDQIRDIVTPVFQSFYASNQTVFMYLSSKNMPYDADALGNQIASLFMA